MTQQKISSRQATLFALKDTLSLYLPVFKAAWPWLLALHLLNLGAEQFFSFGSAYIQESGREDILLLASIASSELLFNLVWSAAWILLLTTFAASFRGRVTFAPEAQAPISRPDLPEAFHLNFNQMLIEQVRALAAVLWRIPLLVIPAVIAYVRYALVPLVVVLEPKYHQGHVDALKKSRDLSRGHFLLLVLLMTSMALIPLLIMHVARGDSDPWVWVNPLGVLIGSALTLFINVAIGIFMFSLYLYLSMMSRH